MQYSEKAEELGAQYAKMDPGSAAKILTEMSEDLPLVCDILENMKESEAAAILQEMDSTYAAQITKKIITMPMAVLTILDSRFWWVFTGNVKVR